MSMTEIEKGLFLGLFNRGGYVLDFTTDAFDVFTKSSVGVALRSRYKLSKGKSLTLLKMPSRALPMVTSWLIFATC